MGLLTDPLTSTLALGMTFYSRPSLKGPRLDQNPLQALQPRKLSRSRQACKFSCLEGHFHMTERQFPKRVMETSRCHLR